MEKDLETPPSVPLGNVLVTGGSGFLGYHLLSMLLERYESPTTTISVLDVRTPQNPIAGVKYYAANLVKADEVREVLLKARPNLIIHAASPMMRREKANAEASKKLAWSVNVDGTNALLEEAKKIGCRCFVYTSSASVISDTYHSLRNADERYDLITGKAQREFYSETKAVAEKNVLAKNTRQPAKAPFLTCAVRPSGIFGEYDVQNLPQMIRALRDGRTRFQLGDNTNLCDYTYVRNVVWAHILAAEALQRTAQNLEEGLLSPVPDQSDTDTKVDGEAFIITNQTPIVFWDFSRAVWQKFYNYAISHPVEGLKPPPAPFTGSQVWNLNGEFVLSIVRCVEFIQNLLGLPTFKPSSQEMRYATVERYFRTTKATQRLGYRPIYTLEEGLDITVAHIWEQEAKGLRKD